MKVTKKQIQDALVVLGLDPNNVNTFTLNVTYGSSFNGTSVTIMDQAQDLEDLMARTTGRRDFNA